MRAIEALLASAIDYAGMFPPAGLCIDEALGNYRRYRDGRDGWALARFVAPVSRARDTGLESEELSLVSGGFEHAGEIVYVEAGVYGLPELRNRNARAKIRTGGLEAHLFPSTETVAEFIAQCARLQLPFKATAGLHHAMRGEYRLTYEPDSASTTMHGFLNILIAASFAWHGGPAQAILDEDDVTNFHIDANEISWRDHRLTTHQIIEARRDFIISFGSCSFEEPMQELRSLGLL